MANPNPLFPFLGSAGRPKKPNALVLTLGMTIRMQPMTGEAPSAYLKRLFNACFTEAELSKQFPTAALMSAAAQSALPSQFGLAAPQSTADQKLLMALNAANFAQPEAVATALRDLIRGYTVAQVNMSNTESPTPAGNSPTHIACQVRDGKDKGFWTRIGVAWAHKDGKGFNIQLECVPLDGKIALRSASEKK